MAYKTAVIIPIYKPEMDECEIISFIQVIKVLKDHDIIMVCPNELNLQEYKKLAVKYNKNISFQHFDNLFFEGINGYNKLMLSLSFYERFLHYDYILIYQLDCFVFKNELDIWTQKNYDYIGAPWLHNDRRTWWTFVNKIRYTLKALYRRYTNKTNTISIGYYKVGNGGFSLRKVKKCCEIIKQFEGNGRIEKYRDPESNYLYAEDVFWGCEVNRYYPNMKIPAYKKALGFSFDMNPSLAYELNNHQLPFGCHAWNRYEPDFWKPFIRNTGFDL